MIKVIKQTLNITASSTECERTNIHQTDYCMEHVQITLIYMGWNLSCSYPWTDVTSLRKSPTNTVIYVYTTLFTLLPSYMFQPSRGPSSGNNDTCREHSQQSTEYVSRCKCMEVKIYFHISYVYWTVHHCDNWRIKDQLNVTCYFISLLMRSTCFGH